MPFTARKERDGKLICLYSKKIQESMHNVYVMRDKLGDLTCPNCGERLTLTKRRGSKFYFMHTSHNNEEPCEMSLRGGRDTTDNQRNHEASVEALIQYCEANIEKLSYKALYGPVTFVTEYPFKQIKRRADICVLDENDNPVVVHEVQLSAINPDEIRERTDDYASLGIRVCWHFGLKAAKDEQLMEWFIKRYGDLSTPFTYYNKEVLEVLH